jgi:hypothetical protein
VHDFDKYTKQPSATFGCMKCNNNIINSSYVTRKVVFHMPMRSTAEVSQRGAKMHPFLCMRRITAANMNTINYD